MKNNYILRLDELLKLLWIIILLGACQSDDSYSVRQDDPVLVKLSVSASDGGTVSGSDEGADAQITSIYILQFNAEGESYGTLRYVSEGKKNGGNYTANLLQSMGTNDNYKLVILANLPDYGFLYGLYGKSYGEVQQACLSEATTDPLDFDATHPFPMFGVVNGGASVQVKEGTVYNSATELIRAVARVDIGIGTKQTAPDGTVTSWTNTGSGRQPFVMTEVQIWRAGQKYAYMPATGNYSWDTAVSNGVTSNKIVVNSPSVAPGAITTKTYDTSYITNGTYCLGKIYLPEADLQWGSVYDTNHANRLAIIVGGNYNGSPDETFYRVDFTYDEGTKEKMNVLRNHVYQFTIKSVAASGYGTAELAYNSKPKNLDFNATVEQWDGRLTTSVPSILGYYLSYKGFNGENVNWTYAEGQSMTIPRKSDGYWPSTSYKFDYNNFYKEGNSYYSPNIAGGQNGSLYATVPKALGVEGTFPNLMVSGDDT